DEPIQLFVEFLVLFVIGRVGERMQLLAKVFDRSEDFVNFLVVTLRRRPSTFPLRCDPASLPRERASHRVAPSIIVLRRRRLNPVFSRSSGGVSCCMPRRSPQSS